MNYNKKTVRDIDVAGKKVLLRCDFNVPMAKDGSGVITDDKRIRAALPTIQYLLEQNAAVVACSHMGKPKGEVKPELSLKPVAARLSELLGIAAPDKLAFMVALGCPTHAARVVPMTEETGIKYYLDENGDYCVPKRSMAEVLLKTM